MDGAVLIVTIFVLFIGLLAAGMAVPFAILLPAVLYLFLQGGWAALHGLGMASWGSMDSYTLTAIPLFVLMAEILQGSGLGVRVYNGLARLVRRVPGGLLQTNIAGCAVFAAVSGSSIATAASIGQVALPQLKARKYDMRVATGSLAAGGTLGILVPPSIGMIVYASFTDTSVVKLFMAGVVPGVALTLMFMAYVVVAALLRPHIAPDNSGDAPPMSALRAIFDIVPFMLLIAGIMGAIYSGIATPTEAAAAGCLFALVIARVFGTLTWRVLYEALKRSMLTVSNILFITYAAFIFSYAMAFAGVGEEITRFIISMQLSKAGFFVALFVLFTLLGALVESLGMIVITVPLLYPLLSSYGIDPVWFGVVVVVFIEMGQITPPIGINLFVIQGISRGNLADVVAGTVPFHALMFVLLALLMVWPELALWLPNHLAAG
ncbi:C4-dicarboxylate ABC transporter [Paraburkholderia unamae]|uniref:TRAP transporter large permease n=1 Tax=Paraburkholderia unamae TaxID=219649 RepID=UPI000DC3A902|nr:TRAP transporter large permease [Paraburkholderia unamae]RAR62679.1 tripartite ATP-independent transporter DctM subunit [Paraburkholderia unamae]CAG9274410.1 C4-dicarboxylate ABC transporter [Paraburkholderia unamae]